MKSQMLIGIQRGILCSFFFLLLLQGGCGNGESEEIESLVADFSIGAEEVLVGADINFRNQSAGVSDLTDYLWDFGDGNSSKLKSPSHQYKDIGSGIYEITLTVSNGNQEAIATQELKISLSEVIDGRKSLIEKLGDEKIMTCAHRAYHKKSPENSIAAVVDAISEGIGMIEIDIRETKDGKLVLMHDKTIDRTTDGTGNVSAYNLTELKEFRLYHNGLLTKNEIPSLREVLIATRGSVYIDLDISDKASFDRVYAVVKQYGMLQQVLFYSNDPDVVGTMLNKDPKVIAMPRIRNESDFDFYSNLDLAIVHYTNDSFNQRLVSKAKQKGWYVFINAYVNSSTTPINDNYGQVDKVVTLEGNIIQTDHPVLLKQYLN